MASWGRLAAGPLGLVAALVLVAAPTQAGTAAQAAALAPAADPVLIDFEDYPANGWGQPATAPLDDFYADRGVVFNGPTVLNYDMGLARPDFTHSGAQAVEACYSQEFCTDPVAMEFATGQVRVGAWVGHGGEIGGSVVLIGYDADGAAIARDITELAEEMQPVDQELEITSPEGAIRRAEVRWEDPARAGNDLVVDDVGFEPAAPLLTAQPDTLDFGSAAAAGEAVERELTVTNEGNTTLRLAAATLEGSSDFTAASECDDATLAPGDSCQVVVVLSPSVEGLQQARLSLLAEGSAPVAVAISGQVTPAPPSPSPTPEEPTDGDGTESTPVPWGPIIGGAVLVVVLLAATATGVSVRRRARARRRVRAPRPHTSLSPGTPQAAVSTPEPLPVVGLLFDPADGTTQWTGETQP